MADTPLVKKLGLKPGMQAAILNAPPGYTELLGQLPEGVTLAERLDGLFDLVQLFVKGRSELERHAPAAIAAVKPDGLLWICYPKITSRLKSDITRDHGWEVVSAAGWGGVSMIAIDETWSAMRFKPGAQR